MINYYKDSTSEISNYYLRNTTQGIPGLPISESLIANEAPSHWHQYGVLVLTLTCSRSEKEMRLYDLTADWLK